MKSSCTLHKPAKRLAAAWALLGLGACFGRGVAPATQAKISLTSNQVLVAAEDQQNGPYTLTVVNSSPWTITARNLRLHFDRPGDMDIVAVHYGSSCDALTNDAVCALELTVVGDANALSFPVPASIYGDNTSKLAVSLSHALLTGGPSNSSHGLVSVGNVRLVPPAPTSDSLVLTNLGHEDVTVTGLVAPAQSHLSFNTTTCPGWPTLAAGSNCNVTVAAPAEAVPGIYALQVSFQGPTGTLLATPRAYVYPGRILLNDASPIQLEGNTTILAIPVENQGFNLNNMTISLPWTDTCDGAISLNLDTSHCTSQLAANATCTLYASTKGATPGTIVPLGIHGRQNDMLLTSEPVQIASLTAHNLSFSAPGQQNLLLDNLTATPLSVLSVRVGGDRAGGFVTPSAADLAACQSFVGRCQIPISAPVNAWAATGATTLTVTYAGNGPVEQAVADLLVPATNVTINGGTPLVLSAAPVGTAVTLTNAGNFAWVSPALATEPVQPGITTNSNCPAALAPGASCSANIVVGSNAPAGLTLQLVAAGANGNRAQTLPLTLQRPLLLAGTDGGGAPVLLTSYDAGATFGASPTLPASFVPEGALLASGLWLVVGSAGGQQAILQSRDRGQSWQAVQLPAAPGTLYGVAASNAGYVAVGYDAGANLAQIRFSADGNGWSSPLANTPTAPLYGVACQGGNCVVAGGAGTLSDTVALHSHDGGQSWQPAANSITPPFAGVLYGAAQAGNVWLLAGQASGGAPALLASQPRADGPYNTTTGVLSGSGSMHAAASNGTRWLAVGADGANQLVNSSVATADGWNSSATALGSGALYAVVWTGTNWAAVGNNGSSQGVLLTSADGVTWNSQTLAPASLLRSIATTP